MAVARKIVHVLACMDRGGVETWLMNVLRNIDRARFHFTFCTLANRPGFFDDDIRTLGGDVVRCPVRPRGGGRFSHDFRAFLHSLRPDVVHSHQLLATGYIAKLSREAGVPIMIAHAHSTGDGRANSPWRRGYRWLMRRHIRKYCTHGIACSGAAGDYVFARDWKERPNYQCLPCGIDITQFGCGGERAALCEELGIPVGRTIIGHVGSFRAVKNHALAVDIVAAMNDPRIHMVFVGEGELRAAVEENVVKRGLRDQFTFTGARGDVPMLMESLFDLFLLPSLYEGLGVVAVEAQCAGLPCLLSDGVAHEVEVVPSLVNWQAVSAPPKRWADQALAILERPKYDRQEALRKIAASVFDIDVAVRVLTEMYSSSNH